MCPELEVMVTVTKILTHEIKTELWITAVRWVVVWILDSNPREQNLH